MLVLMTLCLSEPPSKASSKIAVPRSRSKSVKPASSKASSSKGRSETVVELSDRDDERGLKVVPAQEKRKEYFAEVDNFKMDVEFVV